MMSRLFYSFILQVSVLVFLNKLCVSGDSSSSYRQKRHDQGSPWLWNPQGSWNYHQPTSEFVRTRTVTQPTMTSTSTIAPSVPDTNDDYNPCEPYEPMKPTFSAPGLMISEIKCREYIWESQLLNERRKRTKDCKTKISKAKGLLQAMPIIIGGNYTTFGEFPHMGAIGWKSPTSKWSFKCGSSLISSKFVLTAAHCTSAIADDTITDVVPKIVRFGVRNLLSINISVDVNILHIFAHPLYRSPMKYYDIALIELEKEVKFTTSIQPACLWSQFDTQNYTSKVTVSGWGVTKTDGAEFYTDLQVASIDLIDSQTCDRLLTPRCNRNWCKVHEHQICAGKLNGGVDSCKGDSGGPLQVKLDLNYIIGVTSFGIGCARANTPSVYTRVASFIEWIESIVWL